MPNILLNLSHSLKYAADELIDYNLYSWRSMGHEFAQRIAKEVDVNIIENFDIIDLERSNLASKILKIFEEKNIDIIFPLYNDMLFPYLYKILGFTEKQKDVLSNKEKYTELAKSLNILVPSTFTNIENADYPIIAKPVNGTGSIGVKVLNNYEDYCFFTSGKDIQYNNLEKYYIFQNFIDGITISSAGRIVDGEIFFDCTYTIESSDLPYRAETGFILDPNLGTDNTIKNYISKLAKALDLENCAWMADFIFKDGNFFLIDFSPRLSVSAQSLIKFSANINYNKLVIDSLLYKDKSKVNLNKYVVYRYFDLPKGNHKINFNGDTSFVDELVLPEFTTYMNRIDMFMPLKGYCITSAQTLDDAENLWSKIANSVSFTKED